MRIIASLLFFVVTTAAAATAQDVAPLGSPMSCVEALRAPPVVDLTSTQEPTEEPPANMLRAVIPAHDRLTKRVFIVLDVSSSMSGASLDRAMGAVRALLSSDVDDFEVAIIAFNDQSHRWPGIPEPDAYRPVPAGWARFPSVEALESANAWLAGFGGSGNTRPCDALAEALREQRKDMSILLVTDGIFTGGPEAAIRVVDEGQSRRADSRDGAAVMVVYGLGANAEKQAHLARFGRQGGGGFFVDSNPPPGPTGVIRAVR